MKHCSFVSGEKGTACTGCGYRLKRDYATPPTRDCQANGLGSYIEELLESIGITKDRYMEVKRMFGLPHRCNCDRRKEWLNKVSDWWLSR